MHQIQFVSLGPGDPELITLKGLKALQNADVIFCPATTTSSGIAESRSANILRSLDIPTDRMQLFNIPMKKNREEAFESYERIFEESKALYHQGKRVVIVSEGDAGFYSSIHNILDKLISAGVPANTIPGIPAFIAAGAMANLHIVKQEERLQVIAGAVTEKEMEESLNSKTVLVLMKLSQYTEIIKSFIVDNPEYNYHYFENIGTEKEYYTTRQALILERAIPYFSIMIVSAD